MPSAEYYHRQADLCIRLSRARADKEASARLLILAEAYREKAEETSGRYVAGLIPPPSSLALDLQLRSPHPLDR
jgi:hypothetical protein